jgi:hypothetical protein
MCRSYFFIHIHASLTTNCCNIVVLNYYWLLYSEFLTPVLQQIVATLWYLIITGYYTVSFFLARRTQVEARDFLPVNSGRPLRHRFASRLHCSGNSLHNAYNRTWVSVPGGLDVTIWYTYYSNYQNISITWNWRYIDMVLLGDQCALCGFLVTDGLTTFNNWLLLSTSHFLRCSPAARDTGHPKTRRNSLRRSSYEIAKQRDS